LSVSSSPGVYGYPRADPEQLAQRYTTAAEQLDVLCAYLRMPYNTDIASEKHRKGEREVRHTIIRDHLRDPSSPTNLV
jgi:hypothetical protein